jgi:glycosyltransferase involved in cell wall biosynthesis
MNIAQKIPLADMKNIVIGIVPEGPIAFDGKHYRYSRGERKYIDNLATHFKKVIIYSFVYHPGDVFYEVCSHSPFQSDNIEIVELPASKNDAPSVFEKLIQFLKVFSVIFTQTKRIDYFYLFLPGYPSAMAWMSGRIRGRKHFVYAADDWEQATPGMFKWENLRGGPLYRFFAFLNRTLEKYIAKSALFNVTAGKGLLEKYKAFKRPVVETTPRMTLSRDDIYEREDTCNKGEITLINVGALVFDKAQHNLLVAFADLQKIFPEKLRLSILGDGPRKEDLEKISQDLGIEHRVSFHGHIQDEADLYQFLKDSDIFVLSSVSEGFPRVLYEAMAFQLPIVTTDCGGIPNLMKDRYNARVIRADNVNDLVSAVEDIIKDAPLRRSMIKNSLATINDVFDKMDPKQIPDLLNQNI